MQSDEAETKDVTGRHHAFLSLPIPDLRRRTSSLFQELNKDRELRERFIQNPASVIGQRVTPGLRLTNSELSDSNRLLFSLLANDRFRRWSAAYQESLRRQAEAEGQESIDRRKVRQDFVRAVARFGDSDLLAAFAANAFQFQPGGEDVAIFIIKTESVAFSSTWFIYKVSGTSFENLVLPPHELRALAEETLAHARELQELGRLAEPGDLLA